MPETTSLAAARLLSIVTWLSRQPQHTSTVGDLARHFNRSVRQIERDLDHLTYFRDSLPGDSFELQWEPPRLGARGVERESNTVCIRQSHGMSLPAVLSPELAARAIVGLQALAPTLDPFLRAHVPGTVMAIDALAPGVGRSAHDIDDVLQPTDSALVPLIRTAIAAGQQLHFTYTSATAAVSQRHVVPQELAQSTTGWILVGFDVDRQARRRFLIERMTALTTTDHSGATQQPTGDPTEGCLDTDRIIRVLISARAQWLIGDFATLEPADDTGECPAWPRWVQIRVWNDTWIRTLLIMAADVIVAIDCPRMEANVRSHAQEALSLWTRLNTPTRPTGP